MVLQGLPLNCTKNVSVSRAWLSWNRLTADPATSTMVMGGEGDGCHQSSYMTSYSKEMSGGLCDSHVNSTITKLCPQSKSGEK